MFFDVAQHYYLALLSKLLNGPIRETADTGIFFALVEKIK